MIDVNEIAIAGRLTKDPELKSFGNDGSVCNFTVAVDRGLYGEKAEEARKAGKPTADFFKVSSFGNQGIAISKYVKKGQQIIIEGTIQTSNVTDGDGNKHNYVGINSNHAEFIGSGKQNADQNQDNKSSYKQSNESNKSNFFDGIKEDKKDNKKSDSSISNEDFFEGIDEKDFV